MKIYAKILLFTVKDLRYAAIGSVSPLYLITNKINGNIEESSGNKHLTLLHADVSKDTLRRTMNKRSY